MSMHRTESTAVCTRENLPETSQCFRECAALIDAEQRSAKLICVNSIFSTTLSQARKFYIGHLPERFFKHGVGQVIGVRGGEHVLVTLRPSGR